MGPFVKVFWRQDVHDIEQIVIVDENGAQDGRLRIGIMGRRSLEKGVGF